MEEVIAYEDAEIKLAFRGEILWSIYKKGVIINKDVSSRMISERIRISKGKSYAVVSDPSKVKYWTLNSMNHDMKKHAFNLITVAAVLLTSKVQKIFWDFAINLFPPPIKVKVFNNGEEAEKWLREQMKEEIYT